MKGYFRQDESSHWYFVNENSIKEFDELMRKMEQCEEYSNEWYDLNNEFENSFSFYRLNSPIQDMLVEVD